MRFVPDDFWGVVQSYFLFTAVGSALVCYGLATKQIQFYDYIDFYLLIIGRCCVIASKYGFFKQKYWMIFRNALIPLDIFNRESFAVTENSTGIDLEKNLDEHFRRL